MFHCSICTATPATFRSVDELEIHIAADHVNYVPYECEKCRFSRYPTEFALINHYNNDHGMKEFNIKYKYNLETEKCKAQIREILDKSLNSYQYFRSPKRKRVTVEVVESSSVSSDISPSTSNGTDDYVDKIKDHNNESAMKNGSNLRQIENNFPIHEELNLAQQNLSGFAAGLTDRLSCETNSLFANTSKTYGTTSDNASGLMPNEAQGHHFNMKKSRPPRTCVLCGLQVTGQRSSLVYHANSKHLRVPLFFCQPCNKTWVTIAKSDVLKHVKAVHDGDESVINDYRTQYANEMRQITDKCFPPRQRNHKVEQGAEFGIGMGSQIWLNNEGGGEAADL